MVGKRRMNTAQDRRHTREQAIRKIREADKMLDEGADIATVARHLEVSEQTYHRARDELHNVAVFEILLEAEVLAEDLRIEYKTYRHTRPSAGSRPSISPSRGAKTSPDSHSWWTTNRGKPP